MTTPLPPSIRKQQALATREKLLAAARQEFQARGLAGARVDAIAARAGMNKRLIYVHFGDKNGLFEAVLTRNLESIVNDVPFDPADLPGYAVRLFDYWGEHPEAARLFWWRNLEGSPTTTPIEEEAYATMISEIAARRVPDDDGLPPAHLFAFTLALLQAWAVPSASFSSTEVDAETQRRRQSVHEAVSRLETTP